MVTQSGVNSATDQKTSKMQSKRVFSDVNKIARQLEYINLLMSVQKDEVNSSTQKLCVECNSFFGSEIYKGCCSSCFKKREKEHQTKNDRKTSIETCAEANLENEQSLVEQKQPEKKEEVATQNFQKDKKRCFSCRKKVGLLGIECRCGFVYCNSHRLPQEHDCQFNHKQEAKKKLESELIKCDHSKIDHI